MSTWTDDDLALLDRVGEIKVAGRRADGSLRSLVIVWHVVVDGAVYIRSVRGADGHWYRGVVKHHEGAIAWGGTKRDVRYIADDGHDDAIDAAYFAKYGKGSPSRAITSPEARATTLRVEPR